MNCNLNCQNCLQELCMHKAPLFATLSYEDLKRMAEHMTCCTYEKGERLLSQGDVPQSFFVILEGAAKVSALTQDGREKVLSILSGNDYFGEMYLFGEHRSAFSVEALGPVRACAFSRDEFRALLAQTPVMAVKLVEELGKRVIRLERALQGTAAGGAEARIAALLMDFSEKYAVPGPHGQEIVLPIGREGMASYLGIARETLSRKLRQMEKSGLLISQGNKRMRLLRPDVIEKMAMGDGRG